MFYFFRLWFWGKAQNAGLACVYILRGEGLVFYDTIAIFYIVSIAAIFRVATQRYGQGTLRDAPENGCEGGYILYHSM